MSRKTRKDKIERAAERGRFECGDTRAEVAWHCLIAELDHLHHPESPMPKFRDLLVAIRRAAASARYIK
jgi:hypothetical protein